MDTTQAPRRSRELVLFSLLVVAIACGGEDEAPTPAAPEPAAPEPAAPPDPELVESVTVGTYVGVFISDNLYMCHDFASKVWLTDPQPPSVAEEVRSAAQQRHRAWVEETMFTIGSMEYVFFPEECEKALPGRIVAATCTYGGHGRTDARSGGSYTDDRRPHPLAYGADGEMVVHYYSFDTVFGDDEVMLGCIREQDDGRGGTSRGEWRALDRRSEEYRNLEMEHQRRELDRGSRRRRR